MHDPTRGSYARAVSGVRRCESRASAWLFCIAVLGIGLLSAAFELDRASYRFTCITLAIVILVPHAASHPWMMAVHRFLEASTGIAIGLAFTAVATFGRDERKGQ